MDYKIEQFQYEGKSIIYFDVNDIKDNEELKLYAGNAEKVISAYSHNSVYLIANAISLAYDSNTKEIVSKWIEYNTPYVVRSAMVGIAGIKKMMLNDIIKTLNRKNIKLFNSKKQALDWIISGRN